MKIQCIKLHYILMNKTVYYTMLHICYIWQIKMDCVLKLMQCIIHMAIGLMVSHAAGLNLPCSISHF